MGSRGRKYKKNKGGRERKRIVVISRRINKLRWKRQQGEREKRKGKRSKLESSWKIKFRRRLCKRISPKLTSILFSSPKKSSCLAKNKKVKKILPFKPKLKNISNLSCIFPIKPKNRWWEVSLFNTSWSLSVSTTKKIIWANLP